MHELKPILGVIAALLAFVAYAPYVRDIFKNKTKPHVFSWLLWGTITGIIFALQISAGADWGSLATLSICLVTLFIFFASLRNGKKLIKKIDVVFLVLGLLAIPLWLVTHKPVLAMILLMTVDLLAFAPTVRKSWSQPYTETLSTFVFVIARHILALMAISEYNLITTLLPAASIVETALFATMLIIRRNSVTHGQQ